jgi:hypothetical protein
MSLSVLGDVNWLAVIVATVVYFAIGGLWYMFLFAKQWTRAMGTDPSESQQGSPAQYALPLVTNLVSTIALAMLAYASDTNTVAGGLVLGLVVGIGVAAAAIMATGFFDPQKAAPITFAGINAAYHVVGLAVAGMIIGAWA